MLEHQNEHFARDLLQFSHCVASKSTFSYEFSFEPQSARLPSIFIASQKMPLDAALTMRFAKTGNVTRLKCCACNAKWQWRSPKCCACQENWNTSSENVGKVVRVRHRKRLLTRYETCGNVTKCHACHAKRSYATSETSKSDHSCKARHRHGHRGLTRTVADSCAASSEHSLNPQTSRVKREPLLRIRE